MLDGSTSADVADPPPSGVSTGRPVARPRGIRPRITAIAAAAMVLVLTGAAIALLTAQRRQLTSRIDATLMQRAGDLTTLVVAGGELPPTLPATGDDTTVAQIVSFDGTVLSASRGMHRSALGDLPDDVMQAIRTVRVPQFDDPFRLLTRRVPAAGGPVLVHVGENLDDVREATVTLALDLIIVVPIAALTLAAITWWLVGRTLRPVEAIRSEVAAMGGRDLHRRVPRPRTGDEIDLLAQTMNEMLDRLEDAVQRQQRLVADASHELRTPLTRIRTEVEVELARHDHGAPRELLRSVLEEATALQRLVDDLLHLARSDAGELQLRSRPLDLDDIVLREARRLRDNGRVVVDAGGVSAAGVIGDPDQLGRAVRNLTINAERHAATTVSLSLAERGDRARLIVGNDGTPIPEEQRERIFERFTRLDEARVHDAGGAGLGLAITRDIVERHGGTIHVDPDRRDGAAFVLELPLELAAATRTKAKVNRR